MTRKMCVVTFGCQMNVHDSQRIEEILARDGFARVEDPAAADVIVLNTCSVREKAEQKLRSEAGRLKKHEALVVVAGCVAQQEGDALLKSMPWVDAVVGPDNLAELPALLRDLEGGGPRVTRTVFDLESPRFLASEAVAGAVGASAYVTTMKGCDERCSFCIVPSTRGPERYRPSAEIVDEVVRLVDAGAREITLLGQTVNSYREPGMVAPEDPDESLFPELLARVARSAPSLHRLRYTSPHPRHVTPRLVAAHREIGILASHVHLPVQSGSDRMLKRMIRRYTRAEYVARAEALRSARHGMTLSTDVIVGFPGETPEDFEATLSLVREVGFTGLFGFAYSPRPGTPSLRLQDDVPDSEKSARLTALFEVSEAQLRAHLATLVGTRQEVLLEGPSKPGVPQWVGRSSRNEIVHVDDARGYGPGALVEVEIVRAHKHSLEGRVSALRSPGAPVTPPAVRKKVLPVVQA